MTTIRQIGFGPLGVQIAKYIAQKSTVQTCAVDIKKKLENPYKILIVNWLKTFLFLAL